MATSGSTDFEANRDEIIADALANLGACKPGGTPTGAQLTHAARALNRLVKSIDPSGNFTWRTVRRTLTTTAGKSIYTRALGDFAADVIGIDQPMRFTQSGQTAPTILEPMSRDEFAALDRASTGRTPLRYLVERTLTTFSVTFWPVPTATGDTIEYAAVLRAADFDDGANTPDFPPEWTQALVHGLTGLLAPTYGQASQAGFYLGLFEADRARLVQADTEHGDVRFVPWGI